MAFSQRRLMPHFFLGVAADRRLLLANFLIEDASATGFFLRGGCWQEAFAT